MIKERYSREYKYDEAIGETGLRFETTYPQGFVACSKRPYCATELNISNVLQHTEVQFGVGFTKETDEYIRREFRKILEGKTTQWRIYAVEPRPGEVRLEMQHPFMLAKTRPQLADNVPQDVIDDIWDNYRTITLTVKPRRELDDTRIRLYLQYRDTEKPKEITYIRISLWGDPQGYKPWRTAHTTINLSHKKSYQCCEWYLHWKDADEEDIIAEIEASSL